METVTIQIPDTVEKKTVKAVLKALGVLMEDVEKASRKKNGVAKAAKKERPYNPEFVAKIKKGEEDYAAGRYKIIKLEDLWK